MPIFLTEDGSHSFVSERFGVLYHSSHGAIQETQHVFIDAGLRYVASQEIEMITILEIGFGTGLNALMTYLEAERMKLPIKYISYEMYPLSMIEVQALNFTTLLNASDEVFSAMHQCTWDSNHQLSPFFSLEKRLLPIENIDIKGGVNLIYFDAFAPEIQPHLWEPVVMQKMYDALNDKGVLTTYCAKGAFKRTLKSIGFIVEPLPGPPFKREITRASKFVLP